MKKMTFCHLKKIHKSMLYIWSKTPPKHFCTSICKYFDFSFLNHAPIRQLKAHYFQQHRSSFIHHQVESDHFIYARTQHSSKKSQRHNFCFWQNILLLYRRHQNHQSTLYESFSDVGEIRVWFACKILTPCRMHWNAFLIAQIIAKCHSFPNM